MSHLGRPKGGPDPKYSLKPVAEHLGGHLPFEAEATGALAWDRPNTISVAVENKQLLGRVLARVALPPALFGEGIVAWHRELFSVTWHGGQGFRWSLPALKRSGGFRYDGEGWAMTQDGKRIITQDDCSA